MVGTSLDGIDAGLVEFDASGRPRLQEFLTSDFNEVPVDRLRELASDEPTTAAELSELGFALARDHARAVRAVDPSGRAQLIGAHGVTLAHVPGGSGGHGWQLLNGAALAAITDCGVACDFRSADIALGGQGAPLAPVVDLCLRMSPDEDRIILNLGGIANFTAIPAGAVDSSSIIGGDAGPANLVLDAWMRRSSGGAQHYDDGGALALRGRADETVVDEMMQDPWFSGSLPRSGGREQFGEPWLDRFLDRCAPTIDVADRMATLVAVGTRAIAEQVEAFPPAWRRAGRLHLLVTGGGRHNRAMLEALRVRLPQALVETIEAIGENGDAKEAVDFAWLALQRDRGSVLGISAVTGADHDSVAGALYQPRGTRS
jgi:anhydro-N-acetylmuramic acid kinase